MRGDRPDSRQFHFTVPNHRAPLKFTIFCLSRCLLRRGRAVCHPHRSNPLTILRRKRFAVGDLADAAQVRDKCHPRLWLVFVGHAQQERRMDSYKTRPCIQSHGSAIFTYRKRLAGQRQRCGGTQRHYQLWFDEWPAPGFEDTEFGVFIKLGGASWRDGSSHESSSLRRSS